MAVKKGILDNFLKPSNHYSDNQKNLRSIFIDKSDDDLKPDPKTLFEPSIMADNNTIGTQLEHNKDTNGTQDSIINTKQVIENIEVKNPIGTQLEHRRDTNGTQMEHKWNTIGTQTTRKRRKWNTNGTQMEHAMEHNIEHKRNTKGTQLEHKRDTKYVISYLTGIQKNLLNFFYSSCKKNRSHITEEFALQYIANHLNIRLGSVKTSLRRLEEKGFIKSILYKLGRGGWTKFELPDDIYRELLEMEKEHNWNTNGTQMEHIRNTQWNTQWNTNPPSSSSFKALKTTTTESPPEISSVIPEEWTFDLSPYRQFGFGTPQIKQLITMGKISPADVQQSLIEFIYDLENNSLPPIKTNKLNFLMGLFRAGHAYVSEGYKNEQDATIAEMARRSEAKQKKRLEDKFSAWQAGLSDEEIKKIENLLPTHMMVLYRTYGIANQEIRNWLFNYYLENCSTWKS